MMMNDIDKIKSVGKTLKLKIKVLDLDKTLTNLEYDIHIEKDKIVIRETINKYKKKSPLLDIDQARNNIKDYAFDDITKVINAMHDKIICKLNGKIGYMHAIDHPNRIISRSIGSEIIPTMRYIERIIKHFYKVGNLKDIIKLGSKLVKKSGCFKF